MTLGEHLREFRRRLVICAAAVFVGAIVAAFNYQRISRFLQAPFDAYQADSPHVVASINFAGATSAVSNVISISIFVGLIAASPILLWQAWAFIVPGLTGKEKRISMAFLGMTIPLFLLGCWLAYTILPKSLIILYGFSPEGTSNIVQGSEYYSFVTRFILVFGFGFLFPVVLVGLNVVGVLSARRLLAGWRVAIVLIFVFAAVATPTPDPYTMFVFAGPLTALYFAAWFVCWLLDRRKEKSRPDWLNVDDTEASTI